MSELSIFVITFVGMEGAAWFLHKYVMHGFLWNLHEDHHDPSHKGIFQKNDSFAFFFFLPSFLSILFGKILGISDLSAFGFGIMAYGAAYFLVHEVVIHRRTKWFKSSGFYLNALVSAHKEHHSVCTKEGATNFGMLVVSPKYFVRALRMQKLRTSD